MTAKKQPSPHKLSGPKKFGGWMPDRPKSGQDWLLEKKLGAIGAVPESPTIHPGYHPAVKDQGNLGSCTGESLAYAVESLVIKKKADAGEDVKSSWWREWALSGLAAYYFAREVDGSIAYDAGSYIRSAIDAARRKGIPTEATWPYDISKFRRKPSAAAMKTAAWHKLDTLETYRCDGAGGSREATVTNMLRALGAGMPVNFGFSCPADWGDYDETGRIPVPKGRYEGGHAITAFGADTEARLFLGPNSWGDKIGGPQPYGSRVESRGGKGWFALPFSYVLEGDADDAWAVAL